MITRKDVVMQAPGTGSLMLLITMISMGGFSVSGDGDTQESIIHIEADITNLQIQAASIASDVKHNENLMEKQSEQYDGIMDLLMFVCQIQASSTGAICPT